VTTRNWIHFGSTKRGALVGEFTDRYGASCSIQESSYQDEECIWLGVEVDAMGEVTPNGRMHLTRDQARQLAEVLLHFAADGTIGLYDAEEYKVGAWVVGISQTNRDVLGRVVEAQPGTLLRVQNAQGGAEPWECAWSLVPSSWLPTQPPPQGRSLFEHLDD
jgi:hypothetical protein